MICWQEGRWCRLQLFSRSILQHIANQLHRPHDVQYDLSSSQNGGLKHLNQISVIRLFGLVWLQLYEGYLKWTVADRYQYPWRNLSWGVVLFKVLLGVFQLLQSVRGRCWGICLRLWCYWFTIIRNCAIYPFLVDKDTFGRVWKDAVWTMLLG